MKIAILTQPLGHNYGGLLQAFALQTFLKQRGHQVETIDRRMPVDRVFKLKRQLLNIARLLTGRIKSLPTDARNTMILQHLIRFRDSRLTMSPEIQSSEQLHSYIENNAFNALVVGSDQVWRPRYSPNIYDYFFGFLESAQQPVKRIAYAASFGVDSWEYSEQQTQTCASLIERFEGVSVREKSGVALCREKLGVDADWVVDPTLLLMPSIYEELSERGELFVEKDYMLSYVLDPAEDKRAIARRVAAALNVQSLSIKPDASIEQTETKHLDRCQLPSVESWLKSFKCSQFVVTDSFHGTVFSILFNKPFIAVGNASRGLARFKSLLSEFGLQERLVESVNDITPELLNSEIDWISVNRRRNELAAKGQMFLDTHLSG